MEVLKECNNSVLWLEYGGSTPNDKAARLKSWKSIQTASVLSLQLKHYNHAVLSHQPPVQQKTVIIRQNNEIGEERKKTS